MDFKTCPLAAVLFAPRISFPSLGVWEERGCTEPRNPAVKFTCFQDPLSAVCLEAKILTWLKMWMFSLNIVCSSNDPPNLAVIKPPPILLVVGQSLMSLWDT